MMLILSWGWWNEQMNHMQKMHKSLDELKRLQNKYLLVVLNMDEKDLKKIVRQYDAMIVELNHAWSEYSFDWRITTTNLPYEIVKTYDNIHAEILDKQNEITAICLRGVY